MISWQKVRNDREEYDELGNLLVVCNWFPEGNKLIKHVVERFQMKFPIPDIFIFERLKLLHKIYDGLFIRHRADGIPSIFGTRVFVIDKMACLRHGSDTESEKNRFLSTNHVLIPTRTLSSGCIIDEISSTEKLHMVTLNVHFHLMMPRNEIFSTGQFRQLRSKVLIRVHDDMSDRDYG